MGVGFSDVANPTHPSHYPTSAAALCAALSQGTRDPLFLTGVTFPPDYPLCEDTVLKLMVYDVRDRSAETVSKAAVSPDLTLRAACYRVSAGQS